MRSAVRASILRRRLLPPTGTGGAGSGGSFNLLLESGFVLLVENGSNIVLESATGGGVSISYTAALLSSGQI